MKKDINNISKKIITFVLCLLVSLTAAGCTKTERSDNTNNTDNTTQITLETAEEKALADAGLTVSEVTSIKTKTGQSDGNSIYNVEFYTDSAKYEYEVDAHTGDIYSRSKESVSNQEIASGETQQPADSQNDTQQNNVQSDETQSGDAQTDKEQQNETQADNIQSNETQSDQTPQSDGTSGSGQPNQGSKEQITLDAAKNAALADAGLSASEVTYTKGKLDYEDGIAVYDIEFYTAAYEYEYEINAVSGAVYSKSVDAFDTGAGHHSDSHYNNHNENHYGNTQDTGNDIGIEEAKNIAVSHAGFSSSDVRFTKAEYDWEDGQAVYEIEFYKGAAEYEYTINASTGAIIEYDID